MKEDNTLSGDSSIEQSFSKEDFARILRELADALESSNYFAFHLKGAIISVPPTGEMVIEYERTNARDKVELKISWSQSRSEIDSSFK